MDKSNSIKAGMIFSLALSLSGCDYLISQNPRDSFLSGKFPKQLEWIRSQMREISQKDKDLIIARSKADENRKDLLRVAVIDSGVDVAHEGLLSQLEYHIENDRIVGSGFDIMGRGASGSHVYVDPTIFAFGAEDIIDGKIKNPVESPLALLKQMNDSFTNNLLVSIANDPLLKDSLFKNLNISNINLLSTLSALRNKKNILESYEERKTRGEILFNSSNLGSANLTRSDKIMIDRLKNWNITFGDQDFSNQAFDLMEIIEHADRMMDVLEKNMEKLDSDFGFKKHFSQLEKFLKARNDSASEMDVQKVLGKSMAFIVWGADAFDPFLKFEDQFKKRPELSGKNLEEAFNNYADELQERSDKALKSDKTTDKDRKAVKEAMEAIPMLRQAGKSFEELRNNPKAYAELRSKLRRFLYRTQHPYINEETSSNSHATHVSGVIAKQDSRIRIVPIRVTTSSAILSEERKKEIVERLVSKFEAWMEIPLIKELQSDMLKEEYAGMKVSSKAIRDEIKNYLGKSPLNAIFIDEVLEAVEVAGKNKIKLANVSLGTTFEKKHSLDRKKASFVGDMFSEFARYEIGRTMKDMAPGTLFVIATGNDGGWVDGISKSTFPAGITSTRLLKIADKLKVAPSPNNEAKNVLTVSSVNKNGTLTPFTNIMIDPRIPQIFSTGEEIMSTVPAKNMEAVDGLVSEKLKGVIKLQARLNLLSDKPSLDDMMNGDDIFKKSKFDMDFSKELITQISRMIYVFNPVDRARMSGTSMATPTVTGVIADYLVKKMAAEKISSDQVYEHPDLMPGKIVEQVFAMSKKSPFSSVITINMLVQGIDEWEKSPKEIKAKKAVGQFVNPQKLKCEKIFSSAG